MRVIVDLIRGLAVLVVLLALLFLAFFVNPGMLAWFNHDYAKLAEAYAPERVKLVNKRIEFDSELQDRRRDLADINQKLALTRGKLGSGKDAELQADLDQLLDLKTTEENQIAEQQKSVAATVQDIADIDRVIARVQNQAEDVYLVVRGVALGALGALAQTLVAFMSRRRPQLFREGNSERAAAAMLVGAIVSVILFAVFHTRQISIFDVPSDGVDLRPDFWRVSVVGLLGGAAASWVYHTIAGGRRLALRGVMSAAIEAAAAPIPAPSPALSEPQALESPLPEVLPATVATASESAVPAAAPTAATALEAPKPAPAPTSPPPATKSPPPPANAEAAKPPAAPAPTAASNVRWPPVAATATAEAPAPAASTKLPAW